MFVQEATRREFPLPVVFSFCSEHDEKGECPFSSGCAWCPRVFIFHAHSDLQAQRHDEDGYGRPRHAFASMCHLIVFFLLTPMLMMTAATTVNRGHCLQRQPFQCTATSTDNCGHCQQQLQPQW
jgi:hypothetical protein